MKTYAQAMEIVRVAGLVSLLFMSMQFVPSSAQQNTPFCWERIEVCNRGAKTPMEFQQVCCPVVVQIVSDEMRCFCSIKSSLNATVFDGVSMLLTVCNVTASYNTICPGSPTPSPSTQGTPSAPPLSTTPTPSAPSPGPNSSPNVTPSPSPPGPNSSPSDAPSTPTPAGETPSLTPTPMMAPLGEGPSIAPISPTPPTLMNPPLGSAESPAALSPEDNTAVPASANKIGMPGLLLSGLIVLLTCVLF